MHLTLKLAAVAILSAALASPSLGQDRIVVTPFQVAPLEGAAGVDRSFIERLEREATDRAERSVRAQHLASTVERSKGAAGAAGLPEVSGKVWIVYPIPKEIRGRRAAFRAGNLVRATVSLKAPDGSSKSAEISLKWSDVWWTRGARYRRARPVEDVLRDAVRKAVDKAIKRLA